MELGLRAAEIGKILGLHTASIWKIHARFIKERATILKSKPHGGRHHENLSIVMECRLLKPFLKQVAKSGILIVSSIKAAYEKEVGYRVPVSTINIIRISGKMLRKKAIQSLFGSNNIISAQARIEKVLSIIDAVEKSKAMLD